VKVKVKGESREGNQEHGSSPLTFTFTFTLLALLAARLAAAATYTIVDTAQVRAYDNTQEVPYPKPGEPFCGQDAQYEGNAPSYRDNGDGTVSDLVTGLMWVRDPGEKKTFEQAIAGASKCSVGGHDDWRLPTIKELYSLILFSGTDPDPRSANSARQKPFINTDVFAFRYGDPARNERTIDSQYATCTKYVSTTMQGNETMFGVNFADGRIKGYPAGSARGRREKTYYVMYVRGNPAYGKNDFHDNGDGTITDKATGLVWQKADSGKGMSWQEALAYAEGLTLAGHSDWRLPNAKELQSLVDYTRAPAVTHSPAIDPIFQTTNLAGGEYPYFWSSTTHLDGPFNRQGTAAVYVAFGRALGWMQFPPGWGEYRHLDVHGAGAQRSDPKSGDPAAFPHGRGPQGDEIRISNYVRPVRSIDAESVRLVQPDVMPLPVTARRPQGPAGRPGMGEPPGPGFPPGMRPGPGMKRPPPRRPRW